MRVIRNTMTPRQVVSRKRMAEVFGLSPEAAEGAYKAMEAKGRIKADENGRFVLTNRRQCAGTVQVTKSGTAFLIRDDGGEDVYLGDARGVLPGDKVWAEVPDERDGYYGDREPAAVLLVLKREMSEIVAKVRVLRSRKKVLIPDDVRVKAVLTLPPEDLQKLSDGDVVVVRPIASGVLGPSNLCTLVEVLGKEDDAGMEIEIAVRKFHIPKDFSEATLREVSAFSDRVEKKDTARRVDLRDIPFVTIDGADARDFDDAVYCEPMTRKRWRLLVAIADVSHYVVPGTALDKDAQNRATSVYFPRRVIPMLPEKLSNGLCSLNPQVDRCTMVCDAVIDETGRVKYYQFYPALIRSAARLIYDDVWAAIQNPQGAQATAMGSTVYGGIENLYALFKLLLGSRALRGAMDFETVETYIVANEEGKIEKILPRERNDAHRLIEEMMLVANTCAADFIERSKATSLFRVHEPPSEERLLKLRAFLAPLGLRLDGGDKPQPSDYCRLLEQIQGRPDKNMLQMALLRSMQQAFYSPANVGHFGLAYPAYTHFTSPIRRYPDLLVHRTIRAILNGTVYHPSVAAQPDFADSSYAKRREIEPEPGRVSEDFRTWETLGYLCSACERRADEASYDVMAWLKCYYMQDHIGAVYEGTVSGVTGFALFVTLTDLYVEGSVHISELGNDYFTFDDVGHRLIGNRTGKVFKVGDPVKVRVARCDLELRRIEFVLIQSPADNPRKIARKNRRGKAER
jgi:ribonuclease R